MKRSLLFLPILLLSQIAISQVDTSKVELDTTVVEKSVEESEIFQSPRVDKLFNMSTISNLKKRSMKNAPAGSANGSGFSTGQSGSGVIGSGNSKPLFYIPNQKYNQQNNPAYVNANNKTISYNRLHEGGIIKPEEDFSSGQLTGAELSDFDKYELWQHIAKADFELYSRLWEINPTHRHSIQVITGEGRPAIDIPVQLLNKQGKVLWKARTNNTGSAELWGNGEEGHRIIALVNGKKQTLKQPTLFEDGMNRMTVQMECTISDNVDIAFVVDATGSMEDEIKYLQVEMEHIISRSKSVHTKLNFRTASVFYRCTGNDYSVKHADFTQDVTAIGAFIKAQRAKQGGAELVDSALYVAIDQLNWSKDARARIVFLFLDEPPAKDSLTRANMAKYIAKAAEKGIRIVPVVASANYGTEKSLEYLMRSAALLTNSSYLFLTDDSGIGDPHAKPTADEYQVEKLNKLMLRLISEYTYAPACNEDLTENVIPDTLVIKEIINQVVVDSVLLAFQDSIRAVHPDTLFAETPDTLSGNDWPFDDIPVVDEIKVWPNPTMGNLTVEVKGEATEVYLADISGKIIAKYPLDGNMQAKFDISANPAGIYMVQCLSKKKWLAGKVILMK
ncbi:MAG: T9SS type A sorting domain-containing protein [Flavobacteriales bacterium]|nr:T9SS type A sorting domain-containing protein [Flavobacteriales bacterium]